MNVFGNDQLIDTCMDSDVKVLSFIKQVHWDTGICSIYSLKCCSSSNLFMEYVSLTSFINSLENYEYPPGQSSRYRGTTNAKVWEANRYIKSKTTLICKEQVHVHQSISMNLVMEQKNIKMEDVLPIIQRTTCFIRYANR